MKNLHLPFLPRPPVGRTVVVGAGSAAAALARIVDLMWPRSASLTGLVLSPERQQHASHSANCRVDVFDRPGLSLDDFGKASERVLALVNGLTTQDMVLCLISRDGSEILSIPAAPLTLQEKRRILADLLAAGATPTEVNCVIKHLSRIKGGWLAAEAAPAKVVTLVITDSADDDASQVGFGPTVPDRTTCNEALSILARRQVAVPSALMSLLTHAYLETPKAHDGPFDGHEVHMIAAGMVADYESRSV